MNCDHEPNDGPVVDDAARDRTVRRLLVVRLRLEIAGCEAARPSDPRIEEARQELHALTGARSTPTSGTVHEG